MTPEEKRDYHAAYYAANKDRFRERDAAYRAANKDRIAAYAAANKDRIAEYQAGWRAANKERHASYSAKWVAANKERHAGLCAAYYAANRDQILEQKSAYRAANKDRIAASKAENPVRAAEQVGKWYGPRQAATKKSAIYSYTPWTAAEDSIVIDTSITMVEIAFRLGRTLSSVNNRRHQIRKAMAL